MAVLDHNQLLARIRKVLQDSGIKVNVQRTTKITDLKIDSLELLNLIIKIEQHLKLKLDDTAILKVQTQTVGDLIDLIVKTASH